MFKLFRLFSFIVAVVLIFATSSLAQSPVNEVIINYIEAIPQDSGEVTVLAYVSALDSEKGPNTGLTESNVDILEGGVPIAKEDMSIGIATSPLNLILVLDSSKSLGTASGTIPIDTVRTELINLVEKHLADGDRLAVYSFDKMAFLSQDFTPDHNKAINNGIVGLSLADEDIACLYSAMMKAVDKSTELISGRRIILVLTDSEDTGCQGHTSGGVISKASQPAIGVPIYTLGFGSADASELANIARQTNGVSYFADDIENLGTTIKLMAQQLSSQYQIEFPAQKPGSELSSGKFPKHPSRAWPTQRP